MKYYKFEKIQQGEHPIVRITYKNWMGKFISRDAVQSFHLKGNWRWMDSGELVSNVDSINTFFNNEQDVYVVNGSNSISPNLLSWSQGYWDEFDTSLKLIKDLDTKKISEAVKNGWEDKK